MPPPEFASVCHGARYNHREGTRIISRKNDLLIGQIALELGLIDRHQLKAALFEQTRQEKPKPIGVVLVALGHLSDEQLVRVIDEHHRRMGERSNYSEVRKKDFLIGQLLVKHGHATQEQVNEALRQQQVFAEQRRIRRLGEIMNVSDGVLRDILRRQGKALMSCTGCGARFNVIGGVHDCPKCGKDLEAASHGLAAEESVWGLRAPKGPGPKPARRAPPSKRK